MNNNHSFHIPVMGTGFTIDTPLKLAPYGISSVISLVDDCLIEDIRQYYCNQFQLPYRRIQDHDEDARAKRITAYLDLLDAFVRKDTEDLRVEPFTASSRISKYFELLPDGTQAKAVYRQMLSATDATQRLRYEEMLRGLVVSGSIDANIMTKADCDHYEEGKALPKEHSDAMAALRGFAKSSVNASIVFSAGLNLHLYSYVAKFNDFFADAMGRVKKRITLKVSDFRSAFIQAKIFAKKGIWVSEYRIESGLNCGGHAFATDGTLFGPVLDEFKQKRDRMSEELFEIYRQALREAKGIEAVSPPPIKVTAQGGVGTYAEHQFLSRYFNLDSIGWGTPFLLVPEATNVDDETMAKLIAAGPQDVVLSDSSPLGVPFYNLRNSESERVRIERIAQGRPGSPCANEYLQVNKEYGYPLCTASYEYQRKKIDDLNKMNLTKDDRSREYEKIVEKACICRELGDGVRIKYSIKDKMKKLSPAICPGPNIAFFSRAFSLKEMIDHIYGRFNAMDSGAKRPHVFINELKLYVDYMKKNIQKNGGKLTAKESSYFNQFRDNMNHSIAYYRRLVDELTEESAASRHEFIENLSKLAQDFKEAADAAFKLVEPAVG